MKLIKNLNYVFAYNLQIWRRVLSKFLFFVDTDQFAQFYLK